MPKNCVVRARPDCPYHSSSPFAFRSTRNAPRSCLSNPTAIPTSYMPDSIELYAENSADPPVAQPFATLMNCRPVRPSFDTMTSAEPASWLPP